MWRRWVFEIRAPGDEFLAAFSRALRARGLVVEAGEHFDLVVRAFGARAFVTLRWAEEGLELTGKLKGGLFSSVPALERSLLEAGREAQAALTFGKGAERP